MAANNLRRYLQILRKKRGVSQKDLADAMGLSLRAIVDWETGSTDDIKSVPLTRALEFLQGSFADIEELTLLRDDDEEGVLSILSNPISHRRLSPRRFEYPTLIAEIALLLEEVQVLTPREQEQIGSIIRGYISTRTIT